MSDCQNCGSKIASHNGLGFVQCKLAMAERDLASRTAERDGYYMALVADGKLAGRLQNAITALREIAEYDPNGTPQSLEDDLSTVIGLAAEAIDEDEATQRQSEEPKGK